MRDLSSLDYYSRHLDILCMSENVRTKINKAPTTKYYYNVIFKGESKELIPVEDPEKDRDKVIDEAVIKYAI